MSKWRALLFDLDGTLLDTLPDLTDAINYVLAKHGAPLTTEDAVRPNVSLGTKGMLCHAFSIDRQDPRLSAYKKECLHAYANGMTQKTRLFPGMATLLDFLDQQGTPWGIVTNKSYDFSERLLKHFKLLERSHCLVAGDTLPTRKPDPDTLLHAAALIGHPPNECAYVGDAITDIQAAQRANMFSIAAAYGYLHNNESIKTWGADKIIDSPEALQHLTKQYLA